MMFSSKLCAWSKQLYGTLGVGNKLEPGIASVLILGGSTSGLGIELCLSLILEEKVSVINVDTRDFDVTSSANEASLLSNHYKFIPCNDFSSAESVREAMKNVLRLKIPIHVLINNVQVGFETVFNKSAYIEIGDKAVAHLRKCVDANVTNIIIATKFFLENMVPQTVNLAGDDFLGFYIVNISSVLSLDLPDFATHFVSSKAALNQFHDSLSSELKWTGKASMVKALLLYLPSIDDSEDWEVALTSLADQLVQNLKDGKQGDTILHHRVHFTGSNADLSFYKWSR